MLLKTSLRSFFAHKGRMALSLIAVVLSVAFVSGTLVFSNTATATFDKLFATTASDISVRQAVPDAEGEQNRGGGKPRTVPVGTEQKIAALPGVKSARGEVSVQNAVLTNPLTNKAVGPTSGAPTITGSWHDNQTMLKITSGRAPAGAGEIVLDADTAKKAGLGIGAKLRVIATANHDFTISGIATFQSTNPGAALAFMDLPTAQADLLGSTAFSTVEVTGDGSRSHEELKAAALAALGSGYKVLTAEEQKAEGQADMSFLDYMKYAMLGFAGISLLVGGFLIINTFSMLVAQRTREIGLLRAIGGSRSQVNRSVLVEALILGVLGSTLGLLAGIGLAVGLIQLMKATGMNLSSADLEIGASVPIASYAVGVVITVLAAWIPARRASRISPMAALRDHGTPAEAKANRIRAAIGVLLTAGGAAVLVSAAGASTASTGGQLLGLGVVLTLVGLVVIGPLLSTAVIRVLGAVLPALFGPSGKLAQRNATRNPRRTGATAAALMIGLALVTGASVVTSSMVSSANEMIDQSVGADFVVGLKQQGDLTPPMVTAVQGVQGLEHVTLQKGFTVEYTTPDGKRSKEQLAAATKTFVEDFRMPAESGSAKAAFEVGGVAVGSKFAKEHGLRTGDRITADYGQGRTQELTVGLIIKADSDMFNGTFTNLETVGKAVPAAEQPADQAMFAVVADGADPAKVLAALEDSLKEYPQLLITDKAGYKEIIQSQVNTLLYMVYGLLGLAIVVAVLGVVNTLALSVVERTREIGLLRAIGLSRRQLRRMIRLESVVIAIFGALLGTGLGLAWGVTSQQVLADSGVGLLTVPVATIVGILLASAVIGLLAALLPAFRAGRMNVLAAIATD
ncbi:FtsX-like permease family protein [Kitasatospora sp. CMC57]|uniref:FtsX-like permease family protein n=1 Tax=Kitasatospora sp. CMC57 TaxID=3231513 RepID=A0AB33K0E2_9ACTN